VAKKSSDRTTTSRGLSFATVIASDTGAVDVSRSNPERMGKLQRDSCYTGGPFDILGLRGAKVDAALPPGIVLAQESSLERLDGAVSLQ